MKNSKILQKYILFLIKEKEEELAGLGSTLPATNHISTHISILHSLYSTLPFLASSQEERQSFRIAWISSMRKIGSIRKGGREKEVLMMKKTVEIYDLLLHVKPYMNVLISSGASLNITELIDDELDLIDFGYVHFGYKHVDSNLLYQAYEEAIEKSRYFKSIYPEAVAKLEIIQQVIELIRSIEESQTDSSK